ncbi:DUF5937 family protein [Streptomyces sp. BI20]|uniref:ArsR/SmtB family transcription factor n=1 Tax=Streptomyces sp. BI20 TaxID=3403460 RepID=UPI003C712FC4
MSYDYSLTLAPADLLRCRFAASPLWETVEAVRTLARPARQAYHLPWLRAARAAGAGLDLRPLWLLMPRRGHNPDFLAPAPTAPSAGFAEEAARIRAADPARVREDLARALACTPGAADGELGRRMLADPARAARELAELLTAAWRALVEPYWPRIRALLEADVAHHTRLTARGGLAALFTGVHPEVRWDGAASTLRIGRGTGGHHRVLDGTGLLLMPSVFVWPDVVAGWEEPWQPMLVYPARGVGDLWAGAPPQPSAALAGLLGRGRARVLCAAAEPVTTAVLAARLGMAASSVSAHLRALRAAGLLDAGRAGREVPYVWTPLGRALVSGSDLPGS